ncbi:TPA: hypothetical protein L5P84_006384 [Pseudomonas aeruginosa]|nr:hypothetical protein [Pseudomonas aeruginosa]HCF6600592.1 hypothetical protein [Pseudomonas aeruginosa]
MSKERYQIKEKAKYLCLTIIQHDLECLDEALRAPTNDLKAHIGKLRNTRHVFVILNNLNDYLKRGDIRGNAEFQSHTRKLRKKLGFINHVRNKSAGHIDFVLAERAVQWMPQLFMESSRENSEYRIFESYRALLEASINSFLTGDGHQKVFGHEVDLIYPPDRIEFYGFLEGVVAESIAWLRHAVQVVESGISFHTLELVEELGAIAGKTNFDLKNVSELEYSPEEKESVFRDAIEKLREIGADERVIRYLESKI